MSACRSIVHRSFCHAWNFKHEERTHGQSVAIAQSHENAVEISDGNYVEEDS